VFKNNYVVLTRISLVVIISTNYDHGKRKRSSMLVPPVWNCKNMTIMVKKYEGLKKKPFYYPQAMENG